MSVVSSDPSGESMTMLREKTFIKHYMGRCARPCSSGWGAGRPDYLGQVSELSRESKDFLEMFQSSGAIGTDSVNKAKGLRTRTID